MMESMNEFDDIYYEDDAMFLKTLDDMQLCLLLQNEKEDIEFYGRSTIGYTSLMRERFNNLWVIHNERANRIMEEIDARSTEGDGRDV